MSVTAATATDLGVSEARAVALPSATGLIGRSLGYLRARWTYHVTVAQLEMCSKRVLEDMGASESIRDFARRAAGL